MQSKRRALAVAGALLFALANFQSVPCTRADDGLLEDPVLKARRLFEAKQYKECLDFVEPQALGPEKNNPALQFYYGMLLKYFRRRDEAITRFELVLKLAPYGWMETRSKSMLTELRSAPQMKADPGAGGQLGWTGMKIKDDQIMQVLAGSPAEKARLMAGDKIVFIDGVATKRMDQDGVAARVRGPEGTRVTLIVERQGKQYSAGVVRGPFPGQLASVGASKLSADAAALLPASTQTRAASIGPAPALLASDPHIEILRHTADTDAVYKEIVSTLLQVPPSIRSSLAGFGVKVMLTPTLLEAMPEMATDRPRGYSHGGTYVNCAGLYKPDAKTLYVTERVQSGTYVAHLNINMAHTVLHEFGHAFDHCKNISRSDDFFSAYQTDSGRLTNTVREHFYYYTQSGEAGPSELFAQLFSCAISPEGTINTNDQNLTRTFPSCYALVKKYVAHS